MILRLPQAVLSTLSSKKRLPDRTFLEEVMCRVLRDMVTSSEGKGVAYLRQQMDSLRTFSPNISKVVCSETLVEGTRCLVVTPKNGHDNTTAVIYLHGGGYVMGSPETYKALVADICLAANCEVLVPDYRLAPEVTFPIPQDDCLQVAESYFSTHGDKKRVLVGDSAGGALVISTALALAEVGQKLDGAVLISPWVDPTAEGGSIDGNAEHDYLAGPFLHASIGALMRNQNLKDPRINFKDADLSGLPRTLVQFGSGELFNDQISCFVDRAKLQGVDIESQVYSDQCHVFQFFTAVSKTSRQAVEQIGHFIRSTAQAAGSS